MDANLKALESNRFKKIVLLFDFFVYKNKQTCDILTMTAAQALNQIAELIGSTDKNEIITLAIGTLIENGIETKTAYDAILGEGAYVKMAGMIHDGLNNQ